MNTYWNGFFENIWKRRCALFTDWEKHHGIDARRKKERLARPPLEESEKDLSEGWKIRREWRKKEEKREIKEKAIR